MKALPLGIGAAILLGIVAVASKAKASASPGSADSPKPTPMPSGQAPSITGLPADIAKLIADARASNDPQIIRNAAYQLADNYPLQAANLLALANLIEQPADVR